MEGGRVKVSFPGAPPQLPRPVNAVLGVTYAASSLAVRSLMRADVPVNEGLYSVIEIEASEGSMLNARPPAPVAGETWRRARGSWTSCSWPCRG